MNDNNNIESFFWFCQEVLKMMFVFVFAIIIVFVLSVIKFVVLFFE